MEVRVASGAIATGRRAADIGIERTQEYRLQAIMRHGELVPAAEALEAGDRLVFAASEVGVKTLWESPRFGLSPQHLYVVSVGPGEHGTLLEFEDDDLRVIAAQTAKPLGDTTAIPGATVFVTCSSTRIGRHEAFTLWAQAAGRVPQPGKTWTALGVLAAVVVAASFGLAPVELIAFAGAVLMVLTGVLTPRMAVEPWTGTCCSSWPDPWGSVRSSSTAGWPTSWPVRSSSSPRGVCPLSWWCSP